MNEQVGDSTSVLVALMLRSAGVEDPIVVDWVLHSKSEEAQKWRDYLKELKIYEQEEAIKRQRELRKFAVEQQEGKTKGEIRRIAVVDPVINDDWTARYGLGCWNDEEWLEDTRRKAPEVFLDNGK